MWEFVPKEIWKTEILPRLDGLSLQVLSCTCVIFRQWCLDSMLWENLFQIQLRKEFCRHPSLSPYLCTERWMFPEDSLATPRYIVLSWVTHRCIACKRNCWQWHFDNLIPAYVCMNCLSDDPRFQLITASNAVKEFKIPKTCLSQLLSIACSTPYGDVGRLFQKRQLRALAIRFYGGEENWQLALEKSRERSRKIKQTLERRKSERRHRLWRAIRDKGLKFRDNAYRFSEYIENGNADLEELIEKTWKFKVTNDKLKFPLLWKKYCETRQRKTYGQGSIGENKFREMQSCREILWKKYLQKMQSKEKNDR